MKTRFFKTLSILLFNQRGNFNFSGTGGEGGNAGGANGDGGNSSGNSNSNAGGGQSGGNTDGGQSNQGASTGIQYKYPTTLDKSYHGNATLLKFADDKGEFDHGKVMQSYINLEKHVGKEKIVKPNENFTEDQWKETFRALGVPEDLNDYKVESKLPEGMKGNPEFVDNLRKLAHQAGILPKQLQKVVDYFNEQVVAQRQNLDQSDVAYDKAQNDILVQTWGAGFEKKMGRASEAAKALLSPEELQEVTDMGLFKNATFAKLMSKIADGMDDDKFSNEVKGTFGLTPEEIDAQVAEMYKPGHPFMSSHHPQNEAAKQKFDKLMEAKVKFQQGN